MAQILSPMLGQQVVVDNKGGAAGSVGLRSVASARPDGYTLFFAVGTNVIINPWVQKGMIDPTQARAPVCQTSEYQYVLAVNPKVPAQNTSEPIALAKQQPGKLTFFPRLAWAATTTCRVRCSPKPPESTSGTCITRAPARRWPT